MSKTTNKFSPEVRERAVRMVAEHQGEHASRRAAIVSIAAKIGCAPHTLGHQGAELYGIRPVGDDQKFPVDEAIGPGG